MNPMKDRKCPQCGRDEHPGGGCVRADTRQFSTPPTNEAGSGELPPRIKADLCVLIGNNSGYWERVGSLNLLNDDDPFYLSLEEHSQILASWIKRAEEGKKYEEMYRAKVEQSMRFCKRKDDAEAQLAAERERSQKLLEALRAEDWASHRVLRTIVDEALAQYESGKGGS